MSAALTMQDVVRALARYPARRAVGVRAEFGLRWWTYRELARQVRSAACALRDQGVQAGDRVVLWAGNSPEWVAYFLALSVRGAVAVPIDFGQPFSFVQQVFAECDARLLLLAPGSPARAELRSLAMSMASSDAEHSAELEHALWQDVAPSDCAVIVYSSGSMAAPRGVVLSHANLAAQLSAFRRVRWGLRLLRVRWLFAPPLSRVMGVVLGIALPLSWGMAVIYLEDGSPAHMRRAIRDNRGMIVVMVPALLRSHSRALRQHVGGESSGALGRWTMWRARRQLLGTSCRMFILGGAPLAAEDERLWRASGQLVMQGYGLSETAAVVTVSNPFSRATGTIGRQLAAQELQLAEDGEILLRGPNVSAGYWGERARDAEEFFATGDLAREDASGRLVYLGRKDGVIVVAGGQNVFPEDVEAVLDAQPEVHESAVVGHSGSEGAELHAWLVARAGGDLAAAVYRANQRLPPYQRIRSFRPWPTRNLPRGSLGKLQRPRLARECDAPPEVELRDIAQVLALRERPTRLRALAQYLSRGVHAADAHLTLVGNLGLDSIDLVELNSQMTKLDGDGRSGLPPISATSTLGEVSASLTSTEPRPVRSAGRGAKPSAQPAYAMAWPVRLLRALLQPLFLTLWSWCAATVRVKLHADLTELEGPVVFACEPHHHRLDVWLALMALPRRFRRHTAVLTAAEFQDYFAPGPGTTLRQRIKHWAAYHVVLPLFMPFAIVPKFGATYEGLCHAGALLDRRLSLLAFPFDGRADAKSPPGPGLGILAAQSGRPLVPIYLEGAQDLRWPWKRPRNRVTAHIGRPLHIPAHASLFTITRQMTEEFFHLRLKVLDHHAPAASTQLA